MKVEDLRLGNFVFELFNRFIKQVDINDLSVAEKYQNRKLLPIPYKPINITEEWLFKLKFKYTDREVNRSDGKKVRFYISPNFGKGVDFHLELCINSIDFTRCIWLHWDVGGGNQFIYLPHIPEYVHQIQNIYHSLSGEELVCA